jgi:hypothetical protein
MSDKEKNKTFQMWTHLLKALPLVLALIALTAIVTYAIAGSLDSPQAPENTFSYTLEDIYDRVKNGTLNAKTTFTEPSTGPSVGTMHSIDEIMALFKVGYTRVHKTGQDQCWNVDGVLIPCVGTGHDGEYKIGLDFPREPSTLNESFGWEGARFTDNRDGTVKDNKTGLTWLKDMNCFGEVNWEQSLIHANTLNSGECGLEDGSNEGDWRLPNANELQSLTDRRFSSPAITNPHPFINYDPLIGNFYFWTSTTKEDMTTHAFLIDLEKSDMLFRNKVYLNRTLPVIGGD